MKIEKEDEEEKVNVCKAIQGIEEKGRLAGLAEGRVAGLAEGRSAGLAEGRVAGRSEEIQIGAEREQKLLEEYGID